MKFIKDIIGEQRDRLGAEPHQQTAREDRQFTPPPQPEPVQDIDLKAMSFLRLEPKDRVEEDATPEVVPATDDAVINDTEHAADELDTIAALDKIELHDEDTETAEAEEELEVSSALSEFDQLVPESVEAQAFAATNLPATSRDSVAQYASASAFDAPFEANH